MERQYLDALRIVIDDNELYLDGPAPMRKDEEYLRGQIELLADLFPVEGVYRADRADEIRTDIQNVIADDEEDRQYEARAIAGGKVVDALTELYLVCDMDEAAVGEQMYEVDRAARINAHECTGAVTPDGIQHDGGTCPIHEGR